MFASRSFDDPERAVLHWLSLVYAGDVSGGANRARPAVAGRLLREWPGLRERFGDDPWLACAIGDETVLRRATAADPGWLHRPGGPLKLPPLVAVSHSSLLTLPAWREALRSCARHLLQAGADPDQSIGNRWPPASLAAPDEGERLSALYGAAGQNRDPVLTDMLLQAGADPDDGESLYHALESHECTRLLLQAGARVSGTNAMYRVFDLDDLEPLRLLLAHGGDPNEPATSELAVGFGSPLLWAIRRRRSLAHVQALVAAGASLAATTAEGLDAAGVADRYGLPAIADWLRHRIGGEDSGAEDRVKGASSTAAEGFVAACARNDERRARELLAGEPALIASLQPAQLKMLPELAADGCLDAVRCMVRLGWPIATRGGDWQASALNQAIFRGDAVMADFLLRHGAHWSERHGFGDNAVGTLAWASWNTPDLVDPDGRSGDWAGCARALLAHGLPPGRPDSASGEGILIDGRSLRFADEVAEALLGRDS